MFILTSHESVTMGRECKVQHFGRELLEPRETITAGGVFMSLEENRGTEDAHGNVGMSSQKMHTASTLTAELFSLFTECKKSGSVISPIVTPRSFADGSPMHTRIELRRIGRSVSDSEVCAQRKAGLDSTSPTLSEDEQLVNTGSAWPRRNEERRQVNMA